MKNIAMAVALASIATSASAGDWTGGYVGGQIGYAKVKPDSGIADGSGGIYGLHAGYDYDFGEWVVGGEIDYDRINVDVGNPTAATVDDVARVKFKVGYDFGDVMGYVVAGPARAYTTIGDKTDAFYGVGVSFLGAQQWSVTGEYLYHDFKDIGGTGVDATAGTLTLRASHRF